MGGFVIDKKDLTQALKEVTPCASKDEKQSIDYLRHMAGIGGAK